MRLTFYFLEGKPFRETWFQSAADFAIKEGEAIIDERLPLPYPINPAADRLHHRHGAPPSISEIGSEGR